MQSAIQILSDQDGSNLGSYKVEVSAGVPSLVSAYPSAMQQVKTSHDGGTQTSETDPLATTFVAAVITPQNNPELFSFDTKDKYQAPLAQVSEFLKMKNISIVDSSTPDPGDNSVRIHSDQLSQLMVTSGIQVCNFNFWSSWDTFYLQNKTNASTAKSVISGNRPFGCGFCGKAFSRKEHLIRHKVSHTGKREYKCEICNKTFSRKDNLLKHKKTHGIIGPYVCAVSVWKFFFECLMLVVRFAAKASSSNIITSFIENRTIRKSWKKKKQRYRLRLRPQLQLPTNVIYVRKDFYRNQHLLRICGSVIHENALRENEK